MRSVPNLKIKKSMKNNVIILMNLDNKNENIRAITGRSFLSLKKEVEVLTSLQKYAEISERNNLEKKFSCEWLKELSMYL